jgi:hypothetical protein
MQTLFALVAYLALMFSAAFWMLRAHLQAGPALMQPLFGSRPELGVSANRLTSVGIAIFALGAGLLLVGGPEAGGAWTDAIELATGKFGAYLWIAAAMHFIRFRNLKRCCERGCLKLSKNPGERGLRGASPA